MAGKAMVDYKSAGSKGRLEIADVKSDIIKLADEPAMIDFLKDESCLETLMDIKNKSKPDNKLMNELFNKMNGKRAAREIMQNAPQEEKHIPEQGGMQMGPH